MFSISLAVFNSPDVTCFHCFLFLCIYRAVQARIQILIQDTRWQEVWWCLNGQPVNYLRMIGVTLNPNERKMKVWWCRNGRPPSTAWIFRRIGGRGGLGGYSINLSSHCGGSTSTQMSEILSSGWVRLRSKIRRLNILRIACVNMVGQDLTYPSHTKPSQETEPAGDWITLTWLKFQWFWAKYYTYSTWSNRLDLVQISIGFGQN